MKIQIGAILLQFEEEIRHIIEEMAMLPKGLGLLVAKESVEIVESKVLKRSKFIFFYYRLSFFFLENITIFIYLLITYTLYDIHMNRTLFYIFSILSSLFFYRSYKD